MKKLITATALFLALATASGAVPYNAADNAFSAYAVAPASTTCPSRTTRPRTSGPLKMTARRKK